MSVLEAPSAQRAYMKISHRSRSSRLFGTFAGLAMTVATLGGAGWLDMRAAFAQSEQELSEPGESDQDAATNKNQLAEEREEVKPLEPGEAVVTRFPQTTDGKDGDGKPVKLIDTQGISVSIVDVRNPSEPPIGQHWIDEPQRMFVTASDVGQVFGVAIAQRPDAEAATIFVASTAAYGLHMLDGDWMPGMWGTDGGPGTIYKLSPANGYRPEKFADVTLNGRQNTGAALGNIAYDKAHDRIFVTDLETGMIHSLDAETGEDRGTFDHGNDGRVSFLDVWSQQRQALDPVAFDPKSKARIEECGAKFASDPSCWNLADFRRRVWGLKVRADDAGNVRLYYSVWGSDGFGNPDWADSGDDRRNSVWSVGITEDGLFDTASVRREFFMPAFWPSMPRFGDKAGNSNPVADITFPECSTQNVMLVAERGSMRNFGLEEIESFARPYESRVLRYELGQDDLWRPKGRYDVGFHDRNGNEGEPFLFSSASGGVDFGYKLDANGIADLSKPSQSVWVTGDGLCSPNGPCNDTTKGVGTDDSEVHGLQGSPVDGFVPTEDGVQTAATEQSALFRSYMIDTDINIDEDGKPVAQELTRNDATRIGDVAVYQVCKAAEPLPVLDVPPEGGYVETADPLVVVEPPDDWPVHTLNQSHNKWASTSHRVRASWHYRQGSWHDSRRSWHWRDGSWHQRDKSWHRRAGSWHDRERSWHYKSRSFHSKRQTWGDHDKRRSFHDKQRSRNDGHDKGRSYHVKGRTWQDDDTPTHDRRRSQHVKGRSFGGDTTPEHSRKRSAVDDTPTHDRRRSQHVKGRSFGGDTTPEHSRKRSAIDEKPTHTKERSNADQPTHTRKRSSADDKPTHTRKRSAADDKPKHTRSRSRQDNADVHTKRESRAKEEQEKPRHTRSRSRADNADTHSKAESRAAQQRDEPQHSRRRSNARQDNDNDQPTHSRRSSRGNNDNQQNEDRHSRRESNRANQQQDDGVPQHRRRLSQMQGE